jgi:hypothetical protein
LLDPEEQPLSIGRPLHTVFERFVVGNLARRILWAGFCGIGNVDFDLFQSFESLRDAVG